MASEHILIGTHLNPDGDAIGSALAVSHALQLMGRSHEVLCHHEPPANLQFLSGSERIRQVPARGADLAIVVDLDAMQRLGSTREFIEATPQVILVDHHIPHESPGDMRIVFPEEPATCSILADLFFASELAMTPEMATCLATGIVTDTGSFRYPNTTPHSLHLVGQLQEAGANLAQISEEVYMTKSLPAVRMLGRAIERAQLAVEDRLTWVTLPHEVFSELGASDQDTEGIVNEMLAISTVEIAAILRENRPGKIKGSLRSRSHIDVAEVARQFGGGGHRNAAGVTFEGDLAEAERQLVAALKECLASS